MDSTMLDPLLQALPEVGDALVCTLPPNNARLIALGNEGVYVCSIEVLPTIQLLN
jgi:hypothetical protein